MSDVRRADVCVVAIADAFRGDGEIMANPIGNLPVIGGRVARAVFEPDLMMTDGEALLVANPMPVGLDDPDADVDTVDERLDERGLVVGVRTHECRR